MKTRNLFILLEILFILSSCNSVKQVTYFQDLQSGVTGTAPTPASIKIRPDDKIAITVSSKDPQMASTFNLLMGEARNNIGGNGGTTSGSRASGYTVDKRGYIKFPVLGSLPIEGKTREEVALSIETELVKRDLLKDPIVTVDFVNLCISVLGEVNKPGRFNIDRDNLTLLDALSLAGDLTIYGKRTKIVVLREEGGKQTSHEVNLCSAKDLYASPAYYLSQNDVVYVEPNSMRARQSTVNGNNVRSTSFWMSLTSFLMSITFLIIK